MHLVHGAIVGRRDVRGNSIGELKKILPISFIEFAIQGIQAVQIHEHPVMYVDRSF
jgi:hypothetical protein